MGQSRLFCRLPDNHDREEQDKQNNQAGGTSLKRGRIKQIFPVGLICVIPGGYKLRRLFFGAAKVGDLQSADAIKRKFEVFPGLAWQNIRVITGAAFLVCSRGKSGFVLVLADRDGHINFTQVISSILRRAGQDR